MCVWAGEKEEEVPQLFSFTYSTHLASSLQVHLNIPDPAGLLVLLLVLSLYRSTWPLSTSV